MSNVRAAAEISLIRCTSERIGVPNSALISLRTLSPSSKPGPLKVADYAGGKWNTKDLEPSGVSSVILTASGNAVFCFYVKVVEKEGDVKVYEVRCRRWSDGAWGDSVPITTEKFLINHLAAPIICPPNYAAVWWDERATERRKPTQIHFAKIPNK